MIRRIVSWIAVLALLAGFICLCVFAPSDPAASAAAAMDVAAVKDGTSPAMVTALNSDAFAFELRADQAGLSSKVEVNTFDDVTRLFEARSGLINQAGRVRVAVEIIAQAANPAIIAQGNHNTCALTTLEKRYFQLDPSQAANSIVTVALTGKWTAPDGEAIAVLAKGIQPGPEELKYPVPGLDRSQASEIFQVTVLDGLGLLPNPPAYGEDSTQLSPPVYFEQLKPNLQEGDTGEYWVDSHGNIVGVFLGLTAGNLGQAAHMLFPNSQHFVIANSYLSAPKSVISVSSAKQLIATLAKLEASNDLPAVVMVRGGDPIFGHPLDIPYEQVDHVVEVTIDNAATTGLVYVVNPWGAKYDRWVSAKALYAATQASNQP